MTPHIAGTPWNVLGALDVPSLWLSGGVVLAAVVLAILVCSERRLRMRLQSQERRERQALTLACELTLIGGDPAAVLRSVQEVPSRPDYLT